MKTKKQIHESNKRLLTLNVKTKTKVKATPAARKSALKEERLLVRCELDYWLNQVRDDAKSLAAAKRIVAKLRSRDARLTAEINRR